ncbi:hypothetical protein SGPA1_41225 [Streptomyces misionensis JCM 4497]
MRVWRSLPPCGPSSTHVWAPDARCGRPAEPVEHRQRGLDLSQGIFANLILGRGHRGRRLAPGPVRASGPGVGDAGRRPAAGFGRGWCQR